MLELAEKNSTDHICPGPDSPRPQNCPYSIFNDKVEMADLANQN